MSSSKFGSFVLVLLFLKIVSDRAAGQSLSPVIIPEGSSFRDLAALRGAPDMGRQINRKILAPLAKANNLTGLPDFTMLQAGGGEAAADRLTRLIAIFDDPGLDFSDSAGQGADLAAQIFDHLLNRFALDGAEGTQDYTPAEVSQVAAGVIGISRAERDATTTIYDPACGSGSLLLAAAAAPGWKNDLHMLLFGQDKEVSAVCLARMNMIVHGYYTARIRWGNMLGNPLFRDGGGLRTFDYVLMHAPFSDVNWRDRFEPLGDPFRRFDGYGVPPQGPGDYAYLLHALHSLNESGQAACILPQEALSRGGAEANIRQVMIGQGLIKGVIGLPHNLLPGSSAPACILVLDKSEAATRDAIFMIDASQGFQKEHGRNRLRVSDVARITETFAQQVEVEGFSRLVPIAEIGRRGNDHDLDAARYVALAGEPAAEEPAPPPAPAPPPRAVQVPAQVGTAPRAPRKPARRKPSPFAQQLRRALAGPLPFIIAGIFILAAASAYVLLRPSSVSTDVAQGKTDADVSRQTVSQQPTRQENAGQEDVRQEIERSLAEWSSYRALKQYYLEDYQALVAAIRMDLLAGVPMTTALERASRATEEVRRREAKYYGMASIETLRQDLRARLPVMRHLKTVHGPRACNELAVNGAPALQRFLGERYAADKDLLKLTDGLSAHFLQTAEEGKRLQKVHKALDAADWQVIAKHLLSKGMAESEFVVFADPAKAIDDPRACDIFMAFIDIVTAPDGASAARVIPFMASAAAAEK